MSTLRNYWHLTRPRIVGMVLFTMVVAALVVAGGRPAWTPLVAGLIGSSLVIIGGVAFNQRMEYRIDALMARTAMRPLPTGRLSKREVTVFGLAASVLGLVVLAVWSSAALIVLAVVSWVVYVAVYTPIKPLSTWQTPVGAVAGAMPILLGAAAAGEPWDFSALILFAILYFWQFPHAMAIAWLYRREFAAADLKLVTVVEPTGRTAGWLAVVGAGLLLMVSLIPPLAGRLGWIYGALAVGLGVWYLVEAIGFLRRADDRRARRVLRVSLVYMLLLMAAFLIDTLL